MRFLLILFTLLSFNLNAETLMISINKVVPADKIQEYVNRLNKYDPTTGLYYFQAQVSQYISFEHSPTAPYYGVALVEVEDHGSPSGMADYLKWIEEEQKAGVYTLYSNPRMDPTPIGGGRNGIACDKSLKESNED